MTAADLTPRQLAVLRMIADGLTDREIGTRLGLSESRARQLVAGLYAVIGVERRIDAVRWALTQEAQP